LSRTQAPAARRAALAERHPQWIPGSISEALDAAADRWADRPLVITDDVVLTYEQVRRESIRLAAGLRALGIGRGSRVAVVLANVPEFVPLKYAIARVGATAVPVNFLFRATELGYVLEQSQAEALIVMDRFRDIDYLEVLDQISPDWERRHPERLSTFLRHVVVFPMGVGEPTGPSDSGAVSTFASLATDDEAALAEIARSAPAAPDDLSDILYTSGTTGSPKGVMLTHDMVLRTAYGSAYHNARQDGCRIQFSLPMYHVFGYVECLLAAVYVGGAIVPLVQFQPNEFLRAVGRHGTHEIVCVPTMTLALIDAQRADPQDLSGLVTVFSSGGPSPESIWADIRTVLGAPEITTGYGMSETTAATVCTRPEDPDSLLRTNGVYRQAGIAGDLALGGRLSEYKVVDPVTEEEVAVGARGHLLVRGPQVTPGYFGKPDETAAAFTEDGWLRTGDLGCIDATGALTMTGRLKETYRCGGEMVTPREIEARLAQYPGVAEAHVVGIPDRRMGEVGCAWIVPQSGAQLDPARLIDYCAQHLARFKVPAHVLFTTGEDIPLTATGRVQKFELAARAELMLRVGTGTVGAGR
jgi:fatty-acyl-CoA synthase